jgi:hypothetical protein
MDVFPAFALPIIRTRNWTFGIRRRGCCVSIGATAEEDSIGVTTEEDSSIVVDRYRSPSLFVHTVTTSTARLDSLKCIHNASKHFFGMTPDYQISRATGVPFSLSFLCSCLFTLGLYHGPWQRVIPYYNKESVRAQVLSYHHTVGEMKPEYALLHNRSLIQQKTYKSHPFSSPRAGLAQSRRCSSQSLRWCSAEQYLTNLHLLQTCPRTTGCAVSVPVLFPLTDDALSLLPSLPPPLGKIPSSENATSQSTQLHISRVRTRRELPRARFSGRTTAPSRPFLGKRIISQSSVQQGFGQPEGKSANMSLAGTKMGCVKSIWE